MPMVNRHSRPVNEPTIPLLHNTYQTSFCVRVVVSCQAALLDFALLATPMSSKLKAYAFSHLVMCANVLRLDTPGLPRGNKERAHI
jgi:hypothetical protein